MRLIDADALIKTLNKEKISYNADVNYFIVNAPTIDPVKHGEWIRKSPTAWMWTCSCCKKDDAYAYSAGESFEPDVLQDLFCPNCGAKMGFNPRYILAQEEEERIVALFRKESGDAGERRTDEQT